MEYINKFPKTGETLEQYQFRLSEDKSEYNLTWLEISDLINGYFHKKMSADFIRHEYYGVKKQSVAKVQEDEGYVKILIMNDLHVPYERSDVLEEIENNKDVDYIIFAGDLLDCKSCSFFYQWSDKPSVDEEMVIAHNFISKVNEIIDPKKTKIITIMGNHEKRLEREVERMHQKGLQKMINPQMLGMLASGFTIYEKGKQTHYDGIENFEYIDHWYARLFENLIVAHPTTFSSVDGKMAEKASEYFLNQGIAEKDDVIVFGHTHKFSNLKVNRRQSMYVIENGCMCEEHDYATKSGRLNFTVQNYCYTILKFKENEKIDINDVKVVHLK